MAFSLDKKTRLSITIGISFCFFIAEITVAFKTSSLALLADAFHYLNDLIGFVVALTAQIVSEKTHSPQELSFGWQRARLLGAFFNGVFLLALGISIFLQSIERFISLEIIEQPELVLIIGCVGLGLNILSAAFVHEHHGHDHSHGHSHGHSHRHSHSHSNDHHEHDEVQGTTLGPIINVRSSFQNHAEHRHNAAQAQKPGRDLGMLGVLVHVIGDAINNIGVIIAAVIIWQTSSPQRYYADPAASMFIALMIFISAIPLSKSSGTILLLSAPQGLAIDDVKHDLEKIPGIESVHELHIWRLDQEKSIASAHVVVSDSSMDSFLEKARTVNQCLHAYGIHSATLQPETLKGEQLSRPATATTGSTNVDSASSSLRKSRLDPACQMVCSSLCQPLMCCTKMET